MMKNIFISGSITNEPKYIERFQEAKEYLEDKYPECNIVSPADIDLVGIDYRICMNVTLALLSLCDTIYMLNNYKNSDGALEELEFAKNNGHTILYQK